MKTKGFSTFLDYSMIRKALVAIFTDSVLNKWPAPFEFWTGSFTIRSGYVTMRN